MEIAAGIEYIAAAKEFQLVRKLLCLLFLLCPWFGKAQDHPNPCSSPEASQFDFWIGEWELTYNDTVHCSNHIVKELDGCVISEHFADPSQKFTGKSWSVYDPATNQWQQTWVDNQGGYIVLTGTFKDNKMTLMTAPQKTASGKMIQSRMIFYNITQDSLDWNWEKSSDGGQTWNLYWKIHYTRAQTKH